MPLQATHESTLPALASPERRRLVMWIVVSVFASLVAYFGFRGYLTPELFFQFANALHC
jgi:hypothetical protein